MKKNKWTWEEVYQLGRNSSDAGVRMECERIAVKIVKDIPKAIIKKWVFKSL